MCFLNVKYYKGSDFKGRQCIHVMLSRTTCLKDNPSICKGMETKEDKVVTYSKTICYICKDREQHERIKGLRDEIRAEIHRRRIVQLKWEQRARQNRLFERMDREEAERKRIMKYMEDVLMAKLLEPVVAYCTKEESGKDDVVTDANAVKTMEDGKDSAKQDQDESNHALVLLTSKAGNQRTSQAGRIPLPSKADSENIPDSEKTETPQAPIEADRGRGTAKRASEESERETSPTKRRKSVTEEAYQYRCGKVRRRQEQVYLDDFRREKELIMEQKSDRQLLERLRFRRVRFELPT